MFDGGKVAETGTHLELLALNGRYKKLVSTRTSELRYIRLVANFEFSVKHNRWTERLEFS